MIREAIRPILALAAVGAMTQATVNVDPRLQGRLSGRALAAVTAIVDSAERAGLQTEPLIDRALEAAVKVRNNDDLVIRHVSRFWTAMQQARAALGPASTPAEVTAGANALRAGVDVRELERLRETRQGQRYAGALNSLTTLIRANIPVDTATKVIINLVLAGATDQQISLLQAEIERDLQAGVPAVAAVTARGQGLEVLLANPDNSGLPGTALPSARGTTRPVDPTARPVGGSAVGNTAPGTRPPAPRGKDNKRP